MLKNIRERELLRNKEVDAESASFHSTLVKQMEALKEKLGRMPTEDEIEATLISDEFQIAVHTGVFLRRGAGSLVVSEQTREVPSVDNEEKTRKRNSK
ncbi:MAG: hypothetical protein CMF48_02490 [Legionellales bacterium]|nr:hypothetical protein [Legionellales bacterium]|tara:strand:- start:1155 stop:1448 length:294 start_codon:yes stop_codon:yes gene_type:complete